MVRPLEESKSPLFNSGRKPVAVGAASSTVTLLSYISLHCRFKKTKQLVAPFLAFPRTSEKEKKKTKEIRYIDFQVVLLYSSNTTLIYVLVPMRLWREDFVGLRLYNRPTLDRGHWKINSKQKWNKEHQHPNLTVLLVQFCFGVFFFDSIKHNSKLIVSDMVFVWTWRIAARRFL